MPAPSARVTAHGGPPGLPWLRACHPTLVDVRGVFFFDNSCPCLDVIRWWWTSVRGSGPFMAYYAGSGVSCLVQIQLVATGIEDDCILKTCSQRKSTFPRAFAKLSRSFPGVFCWYKMRAQISSRYFVPDRKLVESFSKALRKLLEGTLSCEHVFKMPSPSIPVATSCTLIAQTFL